MNNALAAVCKGLAYRLVNRETKQHNALHEPPDFHPNCSLGHDLARRPALDQRLRRRENDLADWLFQPRVDKVAHPQGPNGEAGADREARHRLLREALSGAKGRSDVAIRHRQGGLLPLRLERGEGRGEVSMSVGFSDPIMVKGLKVGATAGETTANTRANREFLEKALASV